MSLLRLRRHGRGHLPAEPPLQLDAAQHPRAVSGGRGRRLLRGRGMLQRHRRVPELVHGGTRRHKQVNDELTFLATGEFFKTFFRVK